MKQCDFAYISKLRLLQSLDVIIVFVHYTIFTTTAKKNPTSKSKNQKGKEMYST